MTTKTPDTLTLDALVQEYLTRQEGDPEEVRERLDDFHRTFASRGVLLLECQMLGSPLFGEYTLVAFGPRNTIKDIPTHPVSLHGLASTMSTVKAVAYFGGAAL